MKEVIMQVPSFSADYPKAPIYVADLVRCKECKYFIDNLTEDDTDETYDACRWDWKRRIPTADDFCSYGERKTDE